MSKDSFQLAKRVRSKRLTNYTELHLACECEWPVRMLRNLHGHGKTADGKPCPAIQVWLLQGEERAEAKLIAEET